MGLKNKGVGSLLVDYANGFPLLRELSDQPEKWLEPGGEGILRISGLQCREVRVNWSTTRCPRLHWTSCPIRDGVSEFCVTCVSSS
jgi:hypothetical protein